MERSLQRRKWGAVNFGQRLIALVGSALPLAFVALEASASRVVEASFVCPIGGEEFRFLVQASGYVNGSFLDFKPFGLLVAPDYLPICPSNGFVMYKRKFSMEELASLEEYVLSDAYQSIRKSHTAFYRASRLQRHLSEPAETIAFTLLQATWQAKAGEQYRMYATEALDAYKTLSETVQPGSQRWLRRQLIAGELERRLERFDDAETRFRDLAGMADLVKGVDRDIVELQLRLIAARNSQPEKIPARPQRIPARPDISLH